uniref:Triple QxxK/R motif containing n=1 Tax=Ovis aries TaxID=9940 RepID=A0AC11AY47_SHEEP
MGRKDASTIKLPVDQYRKQIGKQDYKKTKPILRATKLKAEAKKTAIGIKPSDMLTLRKFLHGSWPCACSYTGPPAGFLCFLLSQTVHRR